MKFHSSEGNHRLHAEVLELLRNIHDPGVLGRSPLAKLVDVQQIAQSITGGYREGRALQSYLIARARETMSLLCSLPGPRYERFAAVLEHRLTRILEDRDSSTIAALARAWRTNRQYVYKSEHHAVNWLIRSMPEDEAIHLLAEGDG